jgi:hypothetical protein
VPDRIRLALQGHPRVVAEQLDVATVFTREWRYLEGERALEFLAERRRTSSGSERSSASETGALRSDLDDAAAALLVLSAANWAYTSLCPGADTDALADRFFALILDGIRGYSTPA